MEQTFVMVKPDGVSRGLVGAVVSRFENKGLKLAAVKLMTIPQELAERHYGEHREKKFFGELVEFITSGPVFAMVWEGPQAVKNARSIIGATNPAEAVPGSIRGDYALIVDSNIVHGSDSPESAQREIGLFFG
ncbi:nucleoside diphosphate kinase [Paenibacillus darwinianus]|uniref:Nucleoside diphosphate kinase n=1 Tax=Paenibacillus darwinianus TaxID=1380763 RepID=A0A9W5S2K4_9BACL|nr:nucleoside-diphosphate kinase [Paenibacillus darwinianus]EXX89664.1 nucleoside diphosphate kinase [Paenibacillus darwinianus]EXX89962.1 nucleoside diphosphate kinase [Paenibacillus darwinianus]EXX90222.1 nucleoside diphosphate kinase [Paenibacillus darwinianus]